MAHKEKGFATPFSRHWACERGCKPLLPIDHSVDAEEVAHLQALIAKSMAQLKLKRRPR